VGRPYGQANRSVVEREKLAARAIQAALDGAHTPLEIMMRRMNGDTSITDEQFDAAVACAPYIHPRLSSSDTRVQSDNVHRVISDKPLSIEEWNERYNVHANDATPAPPPDDEDVA
jgi:hypothetical protein